MGGGVEAVARLAGGEDGGRGPGGGHGHDLLGPGARGQVPARPAPVAVDGQERVLPVVPVGHEHHALGGRHLQLDARGDDLRPRWDPDASLR